MEAIDRFKAKVAVDDTGCHIWTAAKDSDGYGQFRDGTIRQAHVWAWEYAHGGDRLPDGYEVDHVCRNRACVNPQHLELVTHDENMRRQREAVKRKKANDRRETKKVSAKLPEKRRRFVEAYLGEAKGNASEAARIAGYAAPGEEGYRLLRNAQVAEAIQSFTSTLTSTSLRSREQWMEWVQTAMDEAEEYRDRLKAAELYGKAIGVFVQRVEHSGPGGNPIEVASDQSADVRKLLEHPEARDRLVGAIEVLGTA